MTLFSDLASLRMKGDTFFRGIRSHVTQHSVSSQGTIIRDYTNVETSKFAVT